jgi:hypothetical protein
MERQMSVSRCMVHYACLQTCISVTDKRQPGAFNHGNSQQYLLLMLLANINLQGLDRANFFLACIGGEIA